MVTYKDSGVDIDNADATKQAMKESIDRGDPRVLNVSGAFASLVRGDFKDLEKPVLVLKTEEPGSKQKLAFKSNRVRSICFDTINHLINDIVVMGATPLYVQDAVICGKMEKEVVTELVAGFADACREQDCVLTGGETSEQPGVLDEGLYILTASIVGVVDEPKICDGSTIQPGDTVLSIHSNGLHTNGYTLVRKLMAENKDLAEKDMGNGETFFDVIMRPHTCYYHCLKGLFGHSGLSGMAHITGGGVVDNLGRILKDGVSAHIRKANLPVLDVFKVIQEVGNVPEEDMLRTYNMGTGVTVVCRSDSAAEIQSHIESTDHGCNVIGEIVEGDGTVKYV